MKSKEAIDLLQDLIRIPSFSTEEDGTANRIIAWFEDHNMKWNRTHNNVWGTNKYFDPSKPTLLLNSHHDTVHPNKGYTRDPFTPDIFDGKLFGLGSNDAGGPLVSLLTTFTHFYSKKNLSHNVVFAATGEEEIAGTNSLRGLIQYLPKIDIAIVGEPTLLALAIAERGLLVVDVCIDGTPSHAAHPNDDNPIPKIKDFFSILNKFKLDRVSDILGPVKITATGVSSSSLEHNVVPSHVNIVLDIRVNELYSNEEVFEILKNHLPYSLKARSFNLKSSGIDLDHPLVVIGTQLGRDTYGSPTLSDMAALDCPAIKLGPGNSTRSHSADEFIYINEIEQGIDFYIKLLTKFLTDETLG